MDPHNNHQNGLSIDFMVPVTADSLPTVLKTHIANKYGYSLHFDSNGWCEAQECSIDFEALTEHLHCLADAADAEGLRIRRLYTAFTCPGPALGAPIVETGVRAVLAELDAR